MTGTHLHIGAGRLGLGLIAATGVQAGLELHVLDKPRTDGAPERLRVELQLRGEDGERRLSPYETASLSCGTTVGDLRPAARAALLQTPHLLVTTAVRTEGVAVCGPFLLELARLRADSPHARTTTFIAGENDPGRTYGELKAALAALGVDCRDTMVNRLCPSVVVGATPEVRLVTVDTLAEWVIAGAPTGAALEALATVDYVRFVDEIEPYEVRKRWLVNGAHLALAIFARRHGLTSIDVAVAEPGRTEWVGKLHEQLIAALELRHPGLDGNAAYAADHVRAWLRHRHDVSLILRRLRRLDLVPFFDDFERKLGEPLRLLGGVARSPHAQAMLDDLDRILHRRNAYVDARELPSRLPRLPLDADVRACVRYRELLEGLLESGEAARREAALSAALGRHRAFYPRTGA